MKHNVAHNKATVSVLDYAVSCCLGGHCILLQARDVTRCPIHSSLNCNGDLLSVSVFKI